MLVLTIADLEGSVEPEEIFLLGLPTMDEINSHVASFRKLHPTVRRFFADILEIFPTFH